MIAGIIVVFSAMISVGAARAELCARRLIENQTLNQIYWIRDLPDGFLLGTYDGLVRFTGTEFIPWQTDTGKKNNSPILYC